MVIYILIFLLIFIATILMKTNTNKQKKIYLFIVFGLMTLFACLRKYTIGIDLQYLYAPYFKTIGLTSFGRLSSINLELGYVFFCKLISLINKDVQCLIIISSIIIYSSYAYFIYKNSENVKYSSLLFILFMLYFMSMNIVRQELAIAIILFAFELLKKKKKVLFVLIIILTSLIHQSAIIFLLLPIFFDKEFKKKHFYIGMIGSGISFVLYKNLIIWFSSLLAFLGLNNNKDYTMYLNSKAFGVPIVNLNSLSELVLALATFLLCLYYFELVDNKKNDAKENIPGSFYIFMTMFYAITMILSFKMVIVARYQYYFLPFVICAIPAALNRSKYDSNKKIVNIVIFLCLIAKFMYIFLKLSDVLYGVMPYEFFWQ